MDTKSDGQTTKTIDTNTISQNVGEKISFLIKIIINIILYQGQTLYIFMAKSNFATPSLPRAHAETTIIIQFCVLKLSQCDLGIRCYYKRRG